MKKEVESAGVGGGLFNPPRRFKLADLRWSVPWYIAAIGSLFSGSLSFQLKMTVRVLACMNEQFKQDMTLLKQTFLWTVYHP